MRVRPRVPSSSLSVAVFVTVALGSAGLVHAQAIRAAALVPQFKTGGMTPELRDKFHDAVVRGLGSLNGPSGPAGELGEVLAPGDTRARLGDELSTCSGQANCLKASLAALHVNRLVSTDVTVSGKTFSISMRLFDGDGRELTHAEELCEICTVREAEDEVTKASARLAAAARTFPIVAVAPMPEAPRTKPRDEAPPVTSLQSPMQEPPPTMASSTARPTVRVVDRTRSHVPWRALGFASFGVGLAGFAVGIPLVVIDGRPTCDAPNPTRQCPQVYSTKAGGGVAIAIGAIGFVAAIPLLYFDYKDRHATAQSFRLDAGGLDGGARVSLAGSF